MAFFRIFTLWAYHRAHFYEIAILGIRGQSNPQCDSGQYELHKDMFSNRHWVVYLAELPVLNFFANEHVNGNSTKKEWQVGHSHAFLLKVNRFKLILKILNVIRI